MTNSIDIRCEQRFANFNRVLRKLPEAIEHIKKGANTTDLESEDVPEEIIKEDLIQRLELSVN